MSDRFDHRLEHRLDTRPDGAEAVRRIEVITGTGRRRPWSSDDKIGIVVESLVPGANVSAVARRHGLSPQQLFGWRREARALFVDGADAPEAPTRIAAKPARATAVRAKPAIASAAGMSARASSPAPTSFAAVVLAAPAVASPAVASPAVASEASAPCGASVPPQRGVEAGWIEITIGEVVVRVGAGVDAGTLAAVLTAVRRAS